jgi:putative ABC transport system substrate-binding protein
LPVDLIIAEASLETEAAKQATSTIPIVMAHSLDAVKTGLVASLSHPGANVTGLTALGLATEKQRLELLKELAPGNARIALLWCPTGPGADPSGQLGEQDWKSIHLIASTLGLELQRLELGGPEDYERAFATASRERAAAVFVRQCYFEKLAGSNLQRLVAIAAQYRLPVIYNSREFVQAGGLMSYGPSWPDGFRQAATYIDRILKGAKPADMAVAQVTKFDLVINLKTAQALGITMPPALLKRADEVIR